jgi:AcrR family transcriptional regulator
MARPSDPNARLELLSAAEQLFVERGLDDTKVEEITERAGRSKGSFYLHFDSKAEAFTQVVESILARLTTFLDEQAAREQAPPPTLHETFESWTAESAGILGFVWDNRSVMRLVLRGGISARFNHLIDEFAARVQRHIFESLQLGVQRGLYRTDLDLRLTSAALAGAYDRISRELVELERKPDLRALIAGVNSALLGGIGTDAVRAYVMTTTPTRKTRAPR